MTAYSLKTALLIACIAEIVNGLEEKVGVSICQREACTMCMTALIRSGYETGDAAMIC